MKEEHTCNSMNLNFVGALGRENFSYLRCQEKIVNLLLYTVEVTNRFKGLDLIDRVTEELWMEVHEIVKEAGIKTLPKKKKCKKAKWLSEEALQTVMKRRGEKAKEKRKDIPTDMQILSILPQIY